MTTGQITRIKRLALRAMFSDDELMDLLVLKGGNALDLIYHIDSARASQDLDFSMPGDFPSEDISKIESKIGKVLRDTFAEADMAVFDIRFHPRPSVISDDMKDFWGGYQVEFKVIEQEKYDKTESIEDRRRGSIALDDTFRKRFLIDISKHEFTGPKEPKDFEGYVIYVYSPLMLVIEKLRAICQQMPEYANHVRNPSQSARARDFFDIYLLFKHFPDIDLTDPQALELVKQTFKAKKVPLYFLKNIPKQKEFHRDDFISVKDTVSPSTMLESYDFYFDFVVVKAGELSESLGVK